MMAGFYVLYIYWRRGVAKDAVFCVNTLNGGKVFNTELVVDGDINVTRCQIALTTSDWICVNIDIDIDMGHGVDRLNSDVRDLGILLGGRFSEGAHAKKVGQEVSVFCNAGYQFKF